jgi:periplasmic divalent cation tolerance protein
MVCAAAAVRMRGRQRAGLHATLRPMDSALLVLSTVPDDAKAAAIARVLVAEKLAACVNRVPGLRSTYRWQGEIHDDAEVLLLAKTTSARFEALRRRLVELHPYELPEIVAVPVEAGLDRYLAWIATETAAP